MRMERLRQVGASGHPAGVVTVLTSITVDPHVRSQLLSFGVEQGEALMAGFPAKLRNSHVPLSTGDLEDYQTVARMLNEDVPAAEERRIGRFTARYVPGRGARPAGLTAKQQRSNCLPFDKTGFYFKPELSEFWIADGVVCGKRTGLYHQKFPFASGHFLVCPDHCSLRPQYLTHDLLRWVWEFSHTLAPDQRIGWNSVAANGSVNHAHFQLVGGGPFPIEHEAFHHNGGTAELYPAQVVGFSAAELDAAQEFLAFVNRADIAFNALFTPSAAYFMPRVKSGQHRPHAAWTGGYAFSEMAGVMVMTQRMGYDSLTEEAVLDEFAKLRS